VKEPGFETLCAHYAEDPARFLGAVVPPIFQNSLFAAPDCETFAAPGKGYPATYEYTRVANPTTDILEAKLAALEKTEAARCFASGDAAVTAAILHGVRSGDHVVAVETSYGPTKAILQGYLRKFNVSVSWVLGTDVQQFADALQPNTKLIYLESPSSLVFHLQDLPAVAALAQERGILTVIDNSWASPYFQNPVELGVDLVVHTTTKYLGGHSDVVGGVVIGARTHLDSIKAREGTLLGGILDPFAAWLTLRGLRTLAVRLDRHQQSALRVARYLEAHPRVARVLYPGLESHPQYALARRQMRGNNGLLSFALKDGTREAAFQVINRLRYFHIAVSWGGYESLAIPIGFPELDDPDVAYVAGQAGTPDNLRWGARLHVGLESVDDLLEDLDQALRL
jgi:cystathionine beta-lyase